MTFPLLNIGYLNSAESCVHRKDERDRWFSSRLYNVYWMRKGKPNRQSIYTPFDSDGNEITEYIWVTLSLAFKARQPYWPECRI